MPTPGLLFAGERPLDPRRTPDELFNRFHGEEHMPGVLAAGRAAAVGLRYKNTRDVSASGVPYLTLYPVADAAVLGFPELARSVEDARGGSRVLAAFDVRAYEKIQTYEASSSSLSSSSPRRGGGDFPRAQMLLCAALEPAEIEGADADLDAWYREEHLALLARSPAYRRDTRYRRIDGGGGDGGGPRYLVLHECACAPADLPAGQLAESCATAWAKRILAGAGACEREVFELIEVRGGLQSP